MSERRWSTQSLSLGNCLEKLDLRSILEREIVYSVYYWTFNRKTEAALVIRPDLYLHRSTLSEGSGK